jgi:hypothetical protein
MIWKHTPHIQLMLSPSVVLQFSTSTAMDAHGQDREPSRHIALVCRHSDFDRIKMKPNTLQHGCDGIILDGTPNTTVRCISIICPKRSLVNYSTKCTKRVPTAGTLVVPNKYITLVTYRPNRFCVIPALRITTVRLRRGNPVHPVHALTNRSDLNRIVSMIG